MDQIVRCKDEVVPILRVNNGLRAIEELNVVRGQHRICERRKDAMSGGSRMDLVEEGDLVGSELLGVGRQKIDPRYIERIGKTETLRIGEQRFGELEAVNDMDIRMIGGHLLQCRIICIVDRVRKCSDSSRLSRWRGAKIRKCKQLDVFNSDARQRVDGLLNASHDARHEIADRQGARESAACKKWRKEALVIVRSDIDQRCRTARSVSPVQLSNILSDLIGQIDRKWLVRNRVHQRTR